MSFRVAERFRDALACGVIGASFVEKGGWAIMPGSKAAESGVSQACAALLSNLK
jgi:hypothetical protein